LNALLIPTNTSSSISQASTSTAVHQDNPVHANSHAVHLTDSTRADTSPLVLKALKNHQVLRTVIDGLVDPIPYGEDGDKDEPDHDFEEKSVRYVSLFVQQKI
jgi:hsp70-interacting protein